MSQHAASTSIMGADADPLGRGPKVKPAPPPRPARDTAFRAQVLSGGDGPMFPDKSSEGLPPLSQRPPQQVSPIVTPSAPVTVAKNQHPHHHQQQQSPQQQQQQPHSHHQQQVQSTQVVQPGAQMQPQQVMPSPHSTANTQALSPSQSEYFQHQFPPQRQQQPPHPPTQAQPMYSQWQQPPQPQLQQLQPPQPSPQQQQVGHQPTPPLQTHPPPTHPVPASLSSSAYRAHDHDDSETVPPSPMQIYLAASNTLVRPHDPSAQYSNASSATSCEERDLPPHPRAPPMTQPHPLPPPSRRNDDARHPPLSWPGDEPPPAQNRSQSRLQSRPGQEHRPPPSRSHSRSQSRPRQHFQHEGAVPRERLSPGARGHRERSHSRSRAHDRHSEGRRHRQYGREPPPPAPTARDEGSGRHTHNHSPQTSHKTPPKQMGYHEHRTPWSEPPLLPRDKLRIQTSRGGHRDKQVDTSEIQTIYQDKYHPGASSPPQPANFRNRHDQRDEAPDTPAVAVASAKKYSTLDHLCCGNEDSVYHGEWARNLEQRDEGSSDYRQPSRSHSHDKRRHSSDGRPPQPPPRHEEPHQGRRRYDGGDRGNRGGRREDKRRQSSGALPRPHSSGIPRGETPPRRGEHSQSASRGYGHPTTRNNTDARNHPQHVSTTSRENQHNYAPSTTHYGYKRLPAMPNSFNPPAQEPFSPFSVPSCVNVVSAQGENGLNASENCHGFPENSNNADAAVHFGPYVDNQRPMKAHDAGYSSEDQYGYGVRSGHQHRSGGDPRYNPQHNHPQNNQYRGGKGSQPNAGSDDAYHRHGGHPESPGKNYGAIEREKRFPGQVVYSDEEDDYLWQHPERRDDYSGSSSIITPLDISPPLPQQQHRQRQSPPSPSFPQTHAQSDIYFPQHEVRNRASSLHREYHDDDDRHFCFNEASRLGGEGMDSPPGSVHAVDGNHEDIGGGRRHTTSTATSVLHGGQRAHPQPVNQDDLIHHPRPPLPSTNNQVQHSHLPPNHQQQTNQGFMRHPVANTTGKSRRIVKAETEQRLSEARQQLLKEITQATNMKTSALDDNDRRFWEKQIQTLNESFKKL